MEDSFNELQLLLGAALDHSNSTKANLQADIDKIKGLVATIDDVKLSPVAIQSLNQQLHQLNLSLNIDIPAIGVGNVGKQAQQAGRQIGRQIQHGVQNVIQKGDFKMNFDFDGMNLKNDTAKRAEAYFQSISNGIVTVHERMKDLDGVTSLDGFTVSIKNAEGAIEHINYALADLLNDAGEVTGKIYSYIGGSIDDAGVIQKFARIDKEYTKFNNKLQKFKVSNVGIDIDTTSFEQLLEDYKDGKISVNQLSNAFNELEVAATKVRSSLKSQNKSLDPVQQAFNNMRDVPNLLKNLSASMNDVKDKTSLADISVQRLEDSWRELNEEMMLNGGKIPTSPEWINKYQSMMHDIFSAENTVNAQKKLESSDNSEQSIKQKYLDKQIAANKELLKLRKALVVAGEEESAVLKKQIKQQEQREKYNREQLEKRGLYDNDAKKVYNDVRDKNEKELERFIARHADNENNKFQKQEDKRKTQVEKTNQQAARILPKLGEVGGDSKFNNDINAVLKTLTDCGMSADAAENNVTELRASLDRMYNLSGEELIAEAKHFADELARAKTEAQAVKSVWQTFKPANEMLDKIDSQTYARDIATEERKFKRYVSADKIDVNKGNDNERAEAQKYVDVYKQTAQAIKEVNDAYAVMTNADNSMNVRLEAEKQYHAALEKTKNLNAILAGDKKNQIIKQGDTQRVNLVASLNKFLETNTAMTKVSENQIKHWIDTLSSVDDVTQDDFDNVKRKFKELEAELRRSGQLGLSVGDKFKQAVEKFGGWSIATGAVMTVAYRLKQMPQAVYDIDTAMTSLYKVTDETDAKYNSFLENAEKNAQKLGRSVSSLVEQSATWAKLGYNIDESAQLAQTSSIYANVGEVDDATAVSDLVTTMKANFKCLVIQKCVTRTYLIAGNG